jgi:hypothetical protein
VLALPVGSAASEMTSGRGYDPGMRRWELTVALDTSRDLPLSLQLASGGMAACR